MHIKSVLFILLCAALLPARLFAAAPASNQPAYDPNIPWEFGSGSSRPLVPLPPQLPAYLPNGAINLDEVWTQDGGARLYWNTLILPQELKMGGATWIDPALVPLLVTEKQPVRRWRRPVRRVKSVPKATVQAPGIPLPVTPVQPSAQAPVKKATPAKKRVARTSRVKTAPAAQVVAAPPVAATPAQQPVPPLTPAYRAAPEGTPGIPIVQEDSSIAPPRLQ